MTPSEQFLQHAAECKSMARFSHDARNKAAWHAMAERWMRCAEVAQVHGSPTPHRVKTKTRRQQAQPEHAMAL